MTEHARVLARLALFGSGIVAGYLLWGRRRRENVVPKTPLTSAPPPFDPAMIRRAPPARLEAGSVDSFVRWVAGTPVSEVQDVRDAIAAARTDREVARALINGLFDLPAKDVGHHQLLLSIIGEMNRAEFVEPLVRFIELPDASIARPVSDDPAGGACTSHVDVAELLKARAVEMLAHLRSAESSRAVLAFASGHESRAVRLAALDAYTYNHDDSGEAIARARAAARPEEAKLVGLARRTREGDPNKFAESVAAFYEQYPEERPPEPATVRKSGHPTAPNPRRTR